MPADNLTRIEAQSRSAVVNNVKYDVFIDITSGLLTGGEGDVFTSVTTVEFDYSPSGSSASDDLTPLFIELKARSVKSIILNGSNVDVSAFRDHRITLPTQLLSQNNKLEICAICAYTNTGEGLNKFVSTDAEDEGEVYLYTQFEVPDAKQMYACFDQPDIKGVFKFSVKAPKGWEITSTMPTPSPSETSDGALLYDFEPTPKMSTYLTSLCAGNFAKWEDSLINADGREIKLQLFVRQSMAKYFDPENVFRTTKQGFEYYANLFNVPYPYAKYDQVFMPQFNAGAMENIGNVTYREDYVFRSKVPDAVKERRVTTILHELAHMWFGDLVTMKWWNDLWLNESFAEYVSTLAGVECTEENKDGWVAFNIGEKSWGMAQDQLISTHPVVAEINDLLDVQVNFDGITYAKGAACLQALQNYCGREQFFKGIENYLNKYAYSNATLEDLLNELDAVCEKDVRSWSKIWLETAGINTLTPQFTVDAAGRFDSFSVVQSANDETPTLRPHSIKIGLYDFSSDDDAMNDVGTKNVTATGSLSLRGMKLVKVGDVDVDINGALTDVPQLIGKPKPAVILLNDQGLTFAKVRFDEGSVNVLQNYIHKVSDPLARCLMLDALWNMCRDAKLSPNDFIDLTFKALASETESITLRQMIAHVGQSVFAFIPAQVRQRVIESVATRFWELAREAQSQDALLQFFLAFCTFASTQEHVSILQKVLQGEIKFPDFDVDLNLKWEIRAALTRLGAFEKANIILARDEDKANRANLGARYCFAAIPTLEAKQAAFDEAFGKHSTLNNDERIWVGRGFAEVLDPSILEGFVAPFFDSLNEIFDNRDFAVAEDIIQFFFPARLANLTLAQAAERWLEENPKSSPALRRMIAESLDGTRRALKVQKQVQ